MLVEYARRARGEEGRPDALPVFDKLLPETYGVMVYQEQLQRMFQQVTG
jgi:DNA polymerase III alpha subunit